MLKKFLKNDSLLQYRRLSFFSNSLQKINDRLYFFSSEAEDETDKVFLVYDFYDDTITNKINLSEILQLEKKDSFVDFVFDGQLVRDEHYAMFYFIKVGKLLFFDLNGNYLFHIETIDETPAPVGFSGPGGAYQTKPSIPTVLDARLHNGQAFVLSNLSNSNHRCIDVYNIEMKQYVSSLRIDALEDGQLPVSFTINTAGEMVVLFENMTLCKYTITEEGVQ
ncbi:hypothetical protein SanaruYs_10900 [Chryseotalea sanaruensis]|uniref:Uncharacterized protein n=1 Tax=Chryseotalea sanaruensis TaxID=2482724 RepID=A0A401U7K0_9BACT|nr:hypothetical protein [Chryseotalea sanaruensis]GCC50871.1 hypothetical protein SanaruYs_10900 [Chryseotalea sanaruensis]